MSSPLVSIIILNWNGWEDTIECLESIFQMNYENYEVVIVDNGSQDDSINKIIEWASGRLKTESPYFQYNVDNKPITCTVVHYNENDFSILEENHSKIKIVSSSKNLGFAKGNNVGASFVLKTSKPKYMLILNNDTVLARDFLSKAISFFEKTSDAGLVCPLILNYYNNEYWQGPAPERLNLINYLMFHTPLQNIFAKLPILYSFKDRAQTIQVYSMPGCSMLFKSSVFEEIGLFDEFTFLGWEEYIVAEKLRIKHWKTYFFPESIVYHKIAKDTSKLDSVEKTLTMIRSEKYFHDTYNIFPSWQKLVIKLVKVTIYLIYSIKDTNYRKNLKRIIKALF